MKKSILNVTAAFAFFVAIISLASCGDKSATNSGGSEKSDNSEAQQKTPNSSNSKLQGNVEDYTVTEDYSKLVGTWVDEGADYSDREEYYSYDTYEFFADGTFQNNYSLIDNEEDLYFGMFVKGNYFVVDNHITFQFAEEDLESQYGIEYDTSDKDERELKTDLIHYLRGGLQIMALKRDEFDGKLKVRGNDGVVLTYELED